MSAVEARKPREFKEHEAEIEKKLALANVEHLVHQFKHDMETLRARMPTQQQAAMEAAKDKKYLAARQASLV